MGELVRVKNHTIHYLDIKQSYKNNTLHKFPSKTKKKMALSIATRWRILSGESKWEGLLHPLDSDLRRYIIHYGERAQAVGDAFILESKSDNYGLCRFAKRNFFSGVGLERGNPFKYEVKKYFYGSAAFIADSCNSAKALPVSPNAAAGNSKWLGFVAVATDEGKEVLGRRDILVSIRGTMPEIEKCIDLKAGLVSASEILGNDNNPKVHEGWYLYYTSSETGSTYNPTSCRDQVLYYHEFLTCMHIRSIF